MTLKNTILFISILLVSIEGSFAQHHEHSKTYQITSNSNYEVEFNQAYAQFNLIPRGLLEAVAYTQTKFAFLSGNEATSCVGLPQQFGVMGLTLNGEGYFNDNLSFVAQHSAFNEEEIKTDASANILAYAEAFQFLMESNLIGTEDFVGIEFCLRMLSEIPSDTNKVNAYALSSFTFQVLNFMRDEQYQTQYHFPSHDIDLETVYGPNNLKLLRSKKVLISSDEVQDARGNTFVPKDRSFDYAPALWVATPSCNYSSRSGTPVSAVTIHTIQGTYAGAISWAQNCNSNVSYHYVVRSTDGQVTQMVYESDKAWHVGSANPYTIGIEHEGYVDNPAWYTVSLYTASAGICKDITQSGYGISPLRTFQGPATTGSNVLGSCTKIKGHQHFPSQTHTDPGINWNWEYFYQLINDNPTITTLSSTSGVFYDSGGASGDYSDDERELYLIEPTGASTVTISFNQFDLEQNWDYLYVYDGTSLQDPLMGVYSGTAIPADITSTGSAILIEFRSDCATQAAGWEISWTTGPGPGPADIIAPTTAVNVNGNWQTTDFLVDFVDADNTGGSGVDKTLYQVIHFDGTEWRANANNGFFSDNFDLAIHPDWTAQVGTWGINSAVLEQTDELNVNTNLWAGLDQDNYDEWLYHFSMNISGTGGNKRGGFHFMCDDPTLPNRGNSYFIWLRSDDDKIQIYKVVNDVFQLESDVAYTINDNQWYDIKTVYNKTTGDIELYINNVLEASWTDSSPYTSGNSISFRSGDANLKAENLKVYHNRSASELVTIGTGNDAQFQNVDPLTPSAKIKSIVIDSAQNISIIGDELANIDWTPPTSIATINDGTGADINTTTTSTQLSANWSSSTDPNSDLQRYWYCIGTSPLATDVVGWTDNWWSDTLTQNGLSLTVGTTYYTCVYAENGAGLFSDTICSDGQTLQVPSGVPTADFVVQNSYICSFEAVQVQNASQDAQSYEWSAPGATPNSSSDINPTFTYTSNGYYDITLIATGIGGVDTQLQTIHVNLDTVPTAAFIADAYVVDISNPLVTFTNQSAHANGYTWDFDDGNISNDTDPWHQFSALGDYYVQLIAVNGLCPNDTTVSLVQVIDDLGVLDEFIGKVEIYPNPATEKINVLLDENWTSNITIQLIDARSRVVFEKEYKNQNDIWIDLPTNIEEAVYFIRVYDAESAVSHKILVKPQ